MRLLPVVLLLTAVPAGALAEPTTTTHLIDADYIDRVNRDAAGFGLSYENGLWGRDYAQGVRATAPLHRHAAVRARALAVHSEVDAHYDPALIGALEMIGRGPVLAGLVRLYGGGGFHLGVRPRKRIEGDRLRLAGGGFFGFEFFHSPRFSFSIEVGGQAPAHGKDIGDGASVMAGLTLYP